MIALAMPDDDSYGDIDEYLDEWCWEDDTLVQDEEEEEDLIEQGHDH